MQTLKLILIKIYKKMPVIAFDILSIPVAWYLSYWLRYNMKPFPNNFTSKYALAALATLMLCQIGCYYYFRVYRGLWRFSSINDVIRIIKAVIIAIVLTLPVLYLTSLLKHIPRSVLPLYSIILTTLLCGGRLLMRTYREKNNRNVSNNSIYRVLIIGAGHAGESLARDMKRTFTYAPIGFVDDNLGKRGLEIHGIRVLGSTRELPELVLANAVNLIFIALPSARSAAMRRIVNLCEACKVPFQTLPSLSDLASGLVKVNALREVNIEDLLGRDQVHLDWSKIGAAIYDKPIAVTGGGGSIGSELCRQIMKLKPSKLLIVDNSEFNLYKIEQELKNAYPHAVIMPVLISITDAVAINFHFGKFKPHIVFHAAAYKHVPMLEDQIRVAVLNNVLGTQIVAEASVNVAAEKFILISTDKAVNPTNVMGTTKRVAEIYCQNLNERATETQFITVRFGNVLGSAGSVVPLFQKQLQQGGPLTVTHPDIQRYFMTIPEACQLILQAMINGSGSEIFVLDMGEPIKISYLAEQIIRLAGKVPGQDIQIKYTGLRPGEKLFEELFHESEELTQTEHEKLFKAKFRKIDWNELAQTIRLLAAACDKHHNDELHILLKSLVPEFKSQMDTVF
ncbi:nucleoside-diphosphate sugar epimerase [Legionella beliardensis]|uniref:Nucleoside-diphosphate sugar epimerase n=1 Tax=Legionella beliardensis TaxID=91822 RepID=A0A378I0C6_9GAMM|nr:nucleoside-diphosphate sugar epimerase/dehydratase [Legionella beliardensis]STX28647.1 nucleoside-diphosphate sugar epimerase [Legionella beliardensis]